MGRISNILFDFYKAIFEVMKSLKLRLVVFIVTLMLAVGVVFIINANFKYYTNEIVVELKVGKLYFSGDSFYSVIIDLVLIGLMAIALAVLTRRAINLRKVRQETSTTLLNLIGRLWHQFTRRRQRQIIFLLLLMVLGAFAEMASLGTVVPFIAALTNPDKLFHYPLVNLCAQWMGIQSGAELMLPLTVIFVVVAVVSGSIRLAVLWCNRRLTVAIGSDIAVKAYRHTLYQPYVFHASNNSSTLISAIVNKVDGVTDSTITPSLTLINSVVLLFTLTVALLAIDAEVAIMTAGILGGVYLVISRMSHKTLMYNGHVIAQAHTEILKALQEGFGGIRDVLLDGTQLMYCSIYRQADQKLRRAKASSQFIAASPRYLMELVGMIVIAVMAYRLSLRPDGMVTALPILSALAMGALRLLPALQQTYAAWASILSSGKSLSDTLDLLESPLPQEALSFPVAPLSFQRELKIKDVYFKYNQEGSWILESINLCITKGMRIGIVGSTGSGKSTLLDLIMGLLEPSKGRIEIDGVLLDGSCRSAWQRSIAHVPQSIYLADTTVAENIAFGCHLHEIDMERVRKAASHAQIAEYLESTSEGYSALIGERGIRLSGGQRQRIGIARALYKQAHILIFDEATSALDNATERAVMRSIEDINKDITIIIIAHRLSTIQHCDVIIQLAHGKIIASGSYDELVANSPSFRDMARNPLSKVE